MGAPVDLGQGLTLSFGWMAFTEETENDQSCFWEDMEGLAQLDAFAKRLDAEICLVPTLIDRPK